jgi:ABC-type amino acid transport substrate-binding protein
MRTPLAQDPDALHGFRRRLPAPATALALALLAATPAGAQAPLDAAGFTALAEGRTLRFTLEGRPYGAEQFLAGRRSLWQDATGACAEGRWWPEGDAICFAYENRPEAQCWRFLPHAGGLAAQQVAAGVPTGFAVDLADTDDRPLACPGPKVGS